MRGQARQKLPFDKQLEKSADGSAMRLFFPASRFQDRIPTTFVPVARRQCSAEYQIVNTS